MDADGVLLLLIVWAAVSIILLPWYAGIPLILLLAGLGYVALRS